MFRLSSTGATIKRELTGQIVHGLPDLPVIDVVAVEKIHISLVEFLVGLRRTAVGCSGALRADDGDRSPRHHRGARRRGHACRYDAQHFFSLGILAREGTRCVICLLRKPATTEVDRSGSTGRIVRDRPARWRDLLPTASCSLARTLKSELFKRSVN